MSKKQVVSVVIAMVFVMVIAGCGGNSDNEESAPPPAETAEVVQENISSLQLVGTAWELESFGEGDLVPSEPDVRSTVNYLVDRYLGTGGCNFYLGVYNVEEDKLTNATPAMTRLACQDPPGVLDQESTFISSLLNTTHFELADDKLYMYTVENQRLMTLFPAERLPLQGTVWSLRFIFGDGEFQPLLPQTTVTIQSDGEELTGNAGCNDYRASVIREDDGTLGVGEITVTEKTCDSPENIMVQEEDYLAALQSAASLEELASALVLYNGDGAPILLFGAQ